MDRQLIKTSLFIAMIVGSFLLVGCEDTPFSKNLPRTPYERYQVLHGKQRQTMEKDSSGIDQPALRERLRPLD